MDRAFARRGLGYVMDIPTITTLIGVDQLYRQRGELHGEITVTTGMPGTRSSDGHLHQATMNLSGSEARSRLAKNLGIRANTGNDVDWVDILEDFCRQVLSAERDGAEPIRVGTLPRPLKTEYRLDPLVPLGAPVLLYGEGGTGKSTIAAAVAVSVETGVAVIPGFVPRKANVLYLDWEADKDEINDRVRGVAMGANLPGPASILYRPCFGPLYRQVEVIARIVTAHDVGLVVVDSIGLAAGTGSDGGDASETALRLFGAFRALATSRAGCSILAIHHISKMEASNDGRPSKPYGSIFYENLARATFELRAGTDGVLGLYNFKANRNEKKAPIALHVEHDEDGSIRYERLDELPNEMLKPLPMHERLYRLLTSEHLDVGQMAEALDEEPNKIRATLSRFNGRLFQKLPSGKWEPLTRAS